MALSARELFLIVRAQNQASGVLRRVGADISGLGAKEQLRARQLALAAKQQAHYAQGVQLRAKAEQLAAKYSPEARLAAQNKLENEALNLTNARQNAYQRLGIAQNRIAALDERRGRAMKSSTQDQIRWRGAMMQARLAESLAGQEIQKTTRKLAENGAEITRQSSTWRRVSRVMGIALNQYPQITTKQRELNTQFANGAAEIERFNQRMQVHTLRGKKIADEAKGIAEAQKAMKFDRLAQGTHLLGSFGRQLQLVGFAGAAALGFAANSAAQLNTQATLAATQVGNNISQVGRQAQANMDAILKQMQQFPAASSDMASALYDIFSTLNVDGKTGRDILVQVNKAAVAGGLSVKDATAGVLSVLSNFKTIPQTAAGVEQALNRSFAAVRFGRITMQEFQTSLQTTAPAAKQAGQSFDNLAGTVAFLTRSLGASKASVGYARLLQQFTGGDMIKGLHQHGIEVRDAAGHYRQLDQIISDIAQKFPKLVSGQMSAQDFFKAMGGTQGTIQASRAFTTLITNVSGYRDILNKTQNDNNEFQKSFDAMNKTAGVEWARTLNILKSLWIEFGAAALSTIHDLVSPLQAVADAMNSMDKSTKDAIGRAVVLGVAIAGLTGVVLSLVAAFGGAVLIFGALSGGALLAVAGLITGIALAVALVIRNWSTLKPILIQYWPDVQNAIEHAVGGIANILDKLASMVEALVRTVAAVLTGDWGAAWDSAVEAVGNFGDLVTIALRGVADLIKGYLDGMTHNVATFGLGLLGIVLIAARVRAALTAMAVGFQGLAVAETEAGAAGAGGGGGLFFKLGGLGRTLVGVGRSALWMAGTMAGAFAAAEGGMAGLSSAAGVLAGALGPVGLVAAAAVAGVALYGLYRWIDSTKSAADQLRDSIKEVSDAAKNVHSGMTDLLNSGVSSRDAALDVRGAKLGVAQAQANVRAATKGTLGYRQAVYDLQRAQNALADSEANVFHQRQIDNSAVKDQIDNVNKLISATGKQAGKIREAQQKASQPLLTAKPGFRTSGSGADVINAQIRDARASLEELQKSQAGNVKQLQASLAAYNELVSRGINPFSKGMSDLRDKLIQAQGDISGWSDTTRAAITQIADGLGRIPTKKEITFVSNHAEAAQGIRTFINITHKIPSKQVVTILEEHRNAQQAIATFIAHFHKIPDKKMIHILSNIDAAAIPQVLRWLRHLNKVPSHKDVKVEAKGAEQAQKKLRDIAQITRHRGKLTVDSSGYIANAKKADDAGKKATKDKKGRIHLFFDPPTSEIIAQGSAVGGQIGSGIVSGLNAYMGQAAAAGAAVANAAIDGARSARGGNMRSPSKKARDQVGKPLGQGVIQGLVKSGIPEAFARIIAKATGATKTKEAIKQASTTAVQFFQDAWNTAADEAKTNFGDLFQGTDLQTKIDWGAKLNISDLQADLRQQDQTFRTFNRNLNQLSRRGAPAALIDQLRALGPAANSELEALNGATKSQLRDYFKLYQTSQKDIRRATKTAFNQQRKEWESHGRNLAVGIILGLKQAGPQLERYFSRLWAGLIHHARRHNKSHSPSMLYAQEGKNIIDGLRLGMERASRGLAVPMPGMGRGHGLRLRDGGGNTYITQNIYAQHSESLMTTMNKATFRLKNRVR